jgi:hypothetical protein
LVERLQVRVVVQDLQQVQQRGSEDEYRRWLPIMAAARMAESIPEFRGWLAGFAGARL